MLKKIVIATAGVLFFVFLWRVVVYVQQRAVHNRVARVQETMLDMRGVCIALGNFARDHDGHYPTPPSPPIPFLKLYNDFPPKLAPKAWPVAENQQVSWLQPFLVPKYIRKLPLRDRWGHPLFCTVSEDPANCTIVSFGSDGRPDNRFPGYSWAADSEKHDLILVGERWEDFFCVFISAPEGFTH